MSNLSQPVRTLLVEVKQFLNSLAALPGDLQNRKHKILHKVQELLNELNDITPEAEPDIPKEEDAVTPLSLVSFDGSAKIDKEGLVRVKSGGGLKNMLFKSKEKKLYFIVQSGCIFVFDNGTDPKQPSSKPKDTLNLSQCTVRDEPQKKAEWPLSITSITKSDKIYVLILPSEDERGAWSHVLNKTVAQSSRSINDQEQEDYESLPGSPESNFPPFSYTKPDTSTSKSGSSTEEDYDDTWNRPDDIYEDTESYLPRSDTPKTIGNTSGGARRQPMPPPDNSPKVPVPITKEETKARKVQDDYANFYFGKWANTGCGVDELSFNRGDMLYVLNRQYDSSGWWTVELGGKIGLVPKNFLESAYVLVAD